MALTSVRRKRMLGGFAARTAATAATAATAHSSTRRRPMAKKTTTLVTRERKRGCGRQEEDGK